MTTEKDVLIIGSGVGGLSTAIILLKLGYNVTIIEKNREPGGMMRSYKRFGIDCPVGVHYIGAMDKEEPLRRIFDYLGVTEKLPLEKMGTDGPIDRYFFKDFTFDLPHGIDAFEANLRSKFPSENAQITEIMNGMRKVAAFMRSFIFPFGNTENFSIFSSFELFNSMGEYLTQLNCSRGLRSVLEVPCLWIGIPLNECPIFFHHNALLSYLFSSWRLNCTGTEMAEVFASRVRELGGKIILGKDADKIITENHTIKGVRLQSGEELNADIVIAAIHPKSMLKILQEGSAKPAYIKRISQIIDTGGVFSTHVGLDAKTHKDLPYNIFKLKTSDDGTITEVAFFQLRPTDNPDINLLTIITASNYSEWKQWEGTSTGNRGNEYINKKQKKAEALLEIATEFFGPLKIVKFLDSYSPLTIRDWSNSPDGSTYGVKRSKDQLLKTASLNRTSVKGLHLAGQSVSAPGILGTTLGSLVTVRDIVGNEILKNDFFEHK